MVTTTMLNNANKVAFMVKRYPKHTLKKITKLFQMPAIDVNTGMWAAEEYNLVKIDAENDSIELVQQPAEWQFGKAVDDLQNALVYAFAQIAKKETDLEETYLGNWTMGYPAHDVMVAIGDLVDRGVLATYDIKDTDKDGAVNTYSFYTLAENASKHWGLQQFGTPPKPGVVETVKEDEVAEIPDAEPVVNQPEAPEAPEKTE
jgi:hypothetical protein